MSRRGNCYDNATAESFFSRFKAELLEGGMFQDVNQARSETFSYIQGYYNRVRCHSALNYKSPDVFARELIITMKGQGPVLRNLTISTGSVPASKEQFYREYVHSDCGERVM